MISLLIEYLNLRCKKVNVHATAADDNDNLWDNIQNLQSSNPVNVKTGVKSTLLIL